MTDAYATEIVAMMTTDDLTDHDRYIMEIFELDFENYKVIKKKFITWETIYMCPMFSHKDLIRRFVEEKLKTQKPHEVARSLGRSTGFIKKITVAKPKELL
jgi:hypothetical protein